MALGIETKGADFDLYVTVLDGRYPTETDYDFSSTNMGADIVFITSEQTTKAASGLLVMVGVRALQDEEADFSLFVNGPKPFEMGQVREIINHDTLTVPVKGNSNVTKENPHRIVFKWYNWGHTNFKVDLRTIGGPYRVYLNSLSETQYEQNIVTAVGLSALNADWWSELSTEEGKRDKTNLVIRRNEIDGKPAFCYNCWYYFTVVIDHAKSTAVQIRIEQAEDGEDMVPLQRNKQTSFDLKSTKKR